MGQSLSNFDSNLKDQQGRKKMGFQLAGVMGKNKFKKPMMDRKDSSIVSSMKSVMKLGRANRPKMPMPMKKAEGM